MSALITGGVALTVIIFVLTMWRRSAAKLGACEALLDQREAEIEKYLEQIDVLSAAPPDLDEQRRMLRKISGNGGND